MKKLAFLIIAITISAKAEYERVVCKSDYEGYEARFVYSEQTGGPGVIRLNVRTGPGAKSWNTIATWSATHTDTLYNQINIVGQTSGHTTGKRGVVQITAKKKSPNLFEGKALVIPTTFSSPKAGLHYPVSCRIRE